MDDPFTWWHEAAQHALEAQEAMLWAEALRDEKSGEAIDKINQEIKEQRRRAADLVEATRKSISEMASRNAAKRHAGTNAAKRLAHKLFRQHRSEFRSLDALAEAITEKIEAEASRPDFALCAVASRTIRRWLTEFGQPGYARTSRSHGLRPGSSLTLALVRRQITYTLRAASFSNFDLRYSIGIVSGTLRTPGAIHQAVRPYCAAVRSHTVSASILPDAFVLFDVYPDSAFVNVRTVGLLYGCTAQTVWRRVRKGVIPAPQKLGVTARWNVGELRRALVDRKPDTDESSSLSSSRA